MLDFADPEIAKREIEYAERVNTQVCAITKAQVQSFTSPYWRTGSLGSDDFGQTYCPENHYQEFIALMLPRLAFSSPTVTVTTARLGPQEKIAIAMKHGINRWIVDSRLEDKIASLATDFLFNFSVAHISMGENKLMTPDMSEPSPKWPEINRLSPENTFRDPQALTPNSCRFFGHQYLIDKDDLIAIAQEENKEDKEAGWMVSAIKEIPEGFSNDDDAAGEAPERKQLCIKEVWVAGYEGEGHPGADEGFHGTIFFYAFPSGGSEQSPVPIRDPLPFYGPPSGPYVVGGMYYVPDSPYHLSSLVANEGTIKDLNDHARAMSMSMKRWKRVIAADNTDPLFAQKVRDAEHDMVIGIEGLDKAKTVPIEVGGLSDQWLTYFGLAKGRVDRNSGISEAMRGAVTGAGTATENALADQSSDTRIAWIKHSFTRFMEQCITKAALYMYYTDEVEIPLGKDASDELGAEPGQGAMFRGGRPDRESGESFDDLELKIEVMSMEHTSEATLQRRALQMLEILTQVAQIAPMAPYMPWKWVLKTIGDALNIPGLAEGFDQNLYEEMVGMALAERTVGMEAQLGKQAKSDGGKEKPEQQIQMPMLQGNSIGSMLGGTTGSSGQKGAA